MDEQHFNINNNEKELLINKSKYFKLYFMNPKTNKTNEAGNIEIIITNDFKIDDDIFQIILEYFKSGKLEIKDLEKINRIIELSNQLCLEDDIYNSLYEC